MKSRLLFLGFWFAALTGPAIAAPQDSQELSLPRMEALFPAAPRRANLAVNITAQTGVYVGQPAQYAVVVANIGNKDANDVRLIVTLPRTHTSPTVHILGVLSAYDNRCTVSGTNLDCQLDRVRKNTSTSVSFTIALPQSSTPLVIGASVTTSSPEGPTTNNNDSETANLLHPLWPVDVGETAHVQHCTGTALTSFYECMLYPSSISSHDISFDSGGLVSFINQSGSYWGTWDQSAGDDRLVLEYYDTGSHEATFDGYAVGPTRCFEGVTTFYPPSQYVAPYRVCVN